MKAFWNERYAAPEYAYGVQPNEYFKQELEKHAPGKLLMPAEGEGRNAVYAATLGWEVTAFDSSISGQTKALQLAEEKQVTIDYQVLDAFEVDFPEDSFDAIGLIYVHLPADFRQTFHRRILSWLKPGGQLILEGFGKEQMHYQSGGPRNPDMLFSVEMLREDFASLKNLEITETLTELREGLYHVGEAAVIRVTGEK